MNNIKIVEFINAEMSLFLTKHGKQLWTKVKIRKIPLCVECRQEIDVPNLAFRPITNAYNRGDRLCVPCFNGLLTEHTSSGAKK